ncbi:type I-E CRISPR-associated protein Cas6/Cse3/CasE [Acerihabitans sp. KWT182]|uniref:Type I-E CRISPR-associated protein Cas6/Cse3/CasE n=1 Tax=Acerihabitans sp. KWT182 TaxID=3157919 RepID=A0AAU7QE88_9GAMM
MFLSKVWIEGYWAKDAYQLHRALWQLFPNRPEEQRDFLFRVEDKQPGRGASVLLQSMHAPAGGDMAHVVASKIYQPAIAVGAKLRFKLRANPVKTIKDERKRVNAKGEIKRCRVPLITEDAQLQWLARKLAGGAELNAAMVIPDSALYFHKNDISGKIQPVTFEGLMTVKHSEIFIKLLSQGVGPGKALGCGLLSLAFA